MVLPFVLPVRHSLAQSLVAEVELVIVLPKLCPLGQSLLSMVRSSRLRPKILAITVASLVLKIQRAEREGVSSLAPGLGLVLGTSEPNRALGLRVMLVRPVPIWWESVVASCVWPRCTVQWDIVGALKSH